MYEPSTGTKIRGRCREVTVSGGSIDCISIFNYCKAFYCVPKFSQSRSALTRPLASFIGLQACIIFFLILTTTPR